MQCQDHKLHNQEYVYEFMLGWSLITISLLLAFRSFDMDDFHDENKCFTSVYFHKIYKSCYVKNPILLLIGFFGYYHISVNFC